MPLGNNGYHSHSDTPMIETLVAAVLLNTDNFARDPDMRRLNMPNGGSLGDRYSSMEDAVRTDDVRKLVCCSSLFSSAFHDQRDFRWPFDCVVWNFFTANFANLSV
jgi:hypothetical protein